MRNPFNRYSKYVLILLVFLFAFSTSWMPVVFHNQDRLEAKVIEESSVIDDQPVVFHQDHPQIKKVMAIQDRHTDSVISKPGIVGISTGLTVKGNPAIIVYAKSYELAKAAALPAKIEDVHVRVKITGELKPLKKPCENPPCGGGGNEGTTDPTARFDRPVPIGVSTGHPDITAGTIGCRVKDGTDVYALSNNHIYANENLATKGDNVLQPGPYEGGIDPDDKIGTLSDFEPISFSNVNQIDAAIAESTTSLLGNSTPSDGYGTPKSITVAASLGMRVMKYGRTTRQTKGRICGIHGTFLVRYDTDIAKFVNQIEICGGSFSAGGDSGSLVVVQKGQDARKPVGLLFAGGGGSTIANPIDAVLDRFGVSVDGE